MASPNRRFAAERHPGIKLGAAIAACATFISIWAGFSATHRATGVEAESPALAAAPDPQTTAPSAAATTATPAPAARQSTVAPAATPTPATSGSSTTPAPTPTATTGGTTRAPVAPVQRRSRGS
jgi:hypothetical protein